MWAASLTPRPPRDPHLFACHLSPPLQTYATLALSNATARTQQLLELVDRTLAQQSANSAAAEAAATLLRAVLAATEDQTSLARLTTQVGAPKTGRDPLCWSVT